jgi:hypothetical protein
LTEDCSPSAAEGAASSLYFLNADGEKPVVWIFDLRRNEGELVLMARVWEMKLLAGEEAARAAARRMKCLEDFH